MTATTTQPKMPARGRRYPMPVISAARRLGEGGWRPYEIVDILHQEHGVTVERSTIARWLDPEKAEAARQRSRERRRRDAAQKDGRIARHITRCVTDEFKLARMRALSERGMNPRGIAIVIEFDFGDALTTAQVSYALLTGRYPRRRSGGTP